MVKMLKNPKLQLRICRIQFYNRWYLLFNWVDLWLLVLVPNKFKAKPQQAPSNLAIYRVKPNLLPSRRLTEVFFVYNVFLDLSDIQSDVHLLTRYILHLFFLFAEILLENYFLIFYSNTTRPDSIIYFYNFPF